MVWHSSTARDKSRPDRLSLASPQARPNSYNTANTQQNIPATALALLLWMWPFIDIASVPVLGSISISQLLHIFLGSSSTQVCSVYRTSLKSVCLHVKARSMWFCHTGLLECKVLHIRWYILPARLIYNMTKYEFIKCNIVLPVNIQKNTIFFNTCLVSYLTRSCTGTYWTRCWQGLSHLSPFWLAEAT